MSREQIDTDRLISSVRQMDQNQGYQSEKLATILERMDKRLSHMEDWIGQLDSEIKRITRRA